MTWFVRSGLMSSLAPDCEFANLNAVFTHSTYITMKEMLNLGGIQNMMHRGYWGARLALDGGDDAEFTYRLDQATALTGKVISSPFCRYDTEVIYRQR